MKTVLITGCSSGYGLETARHFHSQGWNVVATMRTPREDALPRSERLRVLALDVTKPESIAAALEASGPIDVLVNNAGIGLFGAFEATPMATTREVFETNTFGVMAMTQAVLPQFRARRSGVVVNVTSSATLAPMPLVAVYTASKMAIEGFTASLAFELEAFNVQRQAGRAGLRPDHALYEQWRNIAWTGLIPEAYAPFAQRIFASFAQRGCGDDRIRRGRGGVACRERCVRAAAISGGRRRGGAGSVDRCPDNPAMSRFDRALHTSRCGGSRMTKLTTDPCRTNSGHRWVRRFLIVGLVAVGVSGREALAQGMSASSFEAGPVGSTSTPISDAVARLAQSPALTAPRRSPLGRHPVLIGTVIGAGGAAVWQASACGGSSCNTGAAALVGAGAGAYAGLVVSAVQRARAGRPVSRGVKMGLAAGAAAAVAGSWLACYGSGGCGGAS